MPAPERAAPAGREAVWAALELLEITETAQATGMLSATLSVQLGAWE